MAHTVTVLSGEHRGRTVEIEGSVLVGRADDCQLQLSDRRLSRHHARFYTEGPRLFIEDLGSPNGTRVNQRRVRRAVLKEGDTVTLSKVMIRVGPPRERSAPLSEIPTPHLVKPAANQATPELTGMLVDDFWGALGLGDQTLLDADASRLAEIAQKTRHFAALFEISKALAAERSEPQLLATVLDLLFKVTGAERGFVALVDDDGTPEVKVARSVDAAASRVPRLSRTVVEHVLLGRAGIVCNAAQDDTRFASSRSLDLSDTRSVMAAPMIHADRVLGLVVLESGHRHAPFDEAGLDLLSVAASTIGVALDNLRLLQRRDEMIGELRAAQARLLEAQERLVRSEQLAATGRLAAGIAHEVKNHLGPFMLADMIARKYPDDRAIQDASEMMLEAQRHILDLVNEVKAFAGGHVAELDIARHDLVSVIEGVVRFVRCDAEVKRARLHVFTHATPEVKIDAPRIRQVLVNLIRNAAQSVPPDRSPNISLTISADASAARVDVADNGRGIPEEIQNRVFEPFFSTKGEGGLGLGLDIARQIVRQHHGELAFKTQPGSGTTFTIRLPTARPPSPP